MFRILHLPNARQPRYRSVSQLRKREERCKYNIVNSLIPFMYEKWHMSVTRVCRFRDKNSYRDPMQSQNKHIMGELFWIYTITRSQIQPLSTVMAHEWGTTMCNATSGGWKNYHVAGEHIRIADLFWITLQKESVLFEVFASWTGIPDDWIQD
jgi:hypothetical protein